MRRVAERPVQAAVALVLAAALTAAGCAGGPGSQPGEVSAGLPLRTLAPQRLEPGACALFVWEPVEGQDARLIMMIAGEPRFARVQLWRETEDLPQTGGAGDEIFGYRPSQVFAGRGVRLRLDLPLDRAARVADGALIPGGSLEFTGETGWSVVTPVAAVAACEPPRGQR